MARYDPSRTARRPRLGARPAMVREPVQVYLAPDDARLLGRLADETGLSKAEILRRGIRTFAAEQQGDTPMLRFLTDGAVGSWPESIAANHDAVLAEEHRRQKKRR